VTDPHLPDDLRRFWDELVRGEAATPGAIDPALANLIRQLHAQSDVPPLDPVYTKRLREDLMNQIGHAGTVPHTLFPAVPPASNGRAQPGSWQVSVPPETASRAQWRWGFAQLATAALLLLTLGLVYRALNPGRPSNGQPVPFPDLVARSATPAPGGTAEEALVTITLPAAAVPRGEGIGGGLNHDTLFPGTQSTWTSLPDACCPELRLEYVLEGTYTVRAEGTVQILRSGSGGAPETVPARTEVILGPGDALVSSTETAFDGANTGTTPTELLFWILTDANYPTGPIPAGWIAHNTDVQDQLAVPAGPATLRLRRVELAPDATLPTPPGALLFAVMLPGTPQVGRLPDGSVINVNRETVEVYVVTLEPAGPGDGTPLAGTPAPS